MNKMEVEFLSNVNEACGYDEDLNNSCEYFFDYTEQNSKLEERLTGLKNLMENLKSELVKEKELWKKEKEEIEKIAKTKDSYCTCMCEEENNLTRTQYYDEPMLNDLTILDYEQKLNVYKEALTKAHAEKRMHLRRHLAANAYKRKLLEVENMCNMELLRVKQSAQSLQPLQAIALEWNYDRKDLLTNMDSELTGINSKKDGLKKDLLLTVDSLGDRINAEIRDLTLRASPTHSSFETTSSVLQEEDEDALMMRRLQSMDWYNNEKIHPFYNPIM